MHHHGGTSYGVLPHPHAMPSHAPPCRAMPMPCPCPAGAAWCPAAAGPHSGRMRQQRSSTIGGCSRALHVPRLRPRSAAALLPSWAAAQLQSTAAFLPCSRDFTPAEQQLGLHRSVLNFVSGGCSQTRGLAELERAAPACRPGRRRMPICGRLSFACDSNLTSPSPFLSGR